MSNDPPERANDVLAVFVSKAGSPKAMEIPVRTPFARIGQGLQNDVVIDDDSVSTSHARLEYVDGGWRLSDLHSRNGTFVEDVRLEPGEWSLLSSDSAVSFGAVELRFAERGDAEPETARASYLPPAEAQSLTDRKSFRLPLWLLVVLLLLLGLLFAVLVGVPGGTAAVELGTGAVESALTTFAPGLG